MLFACTGNICRSPMAEALFRARVSERAPEQRIGSFGRMFEGEPAHRHARAVVSERGGDLEGFRSRRWNAERLAGAGLVLTMEREHTRELALLETGSIARIFTLPEFHRLARRAGPRSADESLRTWIRRVGADRDLAAQLRDDPADEIEDPIGRSRRRFRACADEIDGLLGELVDLLWPHRPPAAISSGTDRGSVDPTASARPD